MTEQNLRIVRNTGFIFAGVALLVTLLTFTWTILSPGELFPDAYDDPSAANLLDKQVMLLWLWWVLLPGVTAAVAGVISGESLKLAIGRRERAEETQRWRDEQAARPRVSVDDLYDRLAFAGVEHPYLRTRAHLDTYGLTKDNKAVPRYPNDERTHTIAIRYNNLRSNA